MGSGGETETSSKTPKTSAQEQPTATSSSPGTVYPEWSGFQAYSPIPPHGFFHSSVASSPQAHPYMWGPQHLMPPYGTPPPPYVMYPHGGIYAHPSITPGSHPYSPYAIPSPNGNAEASGAMPSGVEMDGKSSEGKKRTPLKRSKGSLGSLNLITGKNNNEVGKTSGASANGAFSQSGDSGSEGSSEGSDANSQNDSQLKTGGGKESFEAMGSQNGSAGHGSQNGVPHTSSKPMPVMPLAATGAPGGVAGPTTTLNIGMDYWGAANPSPIAAIRGKVPHAPTAVGMVSSALPGSRENIPPDLWLQDERELKRQKRKQSNRESARRSRLRKQAECEELAQRVDVLKEENTTLREELSRIRKEYEQLLSKNTSLKERLGEIPRGTENSELDKNDQHPGDDDRQKPVDNVAQTKQTDAVQSGH